MNRFLPPGVPEQFWGRFNAQCTHARAEAKRAGSRRPHAKGAELRPRRVRLQQAGRQARAAG